MRRAVFLAAGLAIGCNQILGVDDPVAGTGERCMAADDEGCPWFLGTPQWLEPLVAPPRAFPVEPLVGNVPTWISEDGLRLYVVLEAAGGSSLHVASRSRPAEPFAGATPVAGLDDLIVRSATFTADEATAVLEAVPAATPTAASDLYIAWRVGPGEPFTELVRMDELSTDAAERRPALRGDGLELVYEGATSVVTSELRRAVRGRDDVPFDPPVAQAGIAGSRVGAPYLSRDARTLFFHEDTDGTTRLARAERPDLAADFAGGEELLALDDGDVFTPVVSEATGELFVGSNAPFSTAARGLWRARICRDAACPPVALACAGALSPDGLHCYLRGGDGLEYDEAAADCERRGGHLADLHSEAEVAIAFDQHGDTVEGMWQAGRRPAGEPDPTGWGWITGRPWTFEAWRGSEPNNGGGGVDEACAAMLIEGGGGWTDYPCDVQLTALCEVESYPTW